MEGRLFLSLFNAALFLREPSHSISLLSFFIALCNQAVYYRNLMIFDGIDRR